MTRQPDDAHAFPFLTSAALIALTLSAAAMVSVALLGALNLSHHVRLSLTAAAVCGLAAVAALWPVWALARRRGAMGAAMGFLAGILVRMILCGAGVLILQDRSADGPALSLWIGAWYMIVLTVETGLIARYLSRLPKPGPA